MLAALGNKQQAVRNDIRNMQIKRLWRRGLRVGAWLLVVIMVVWGWLELYNPNFLPIKQVQIDGNGPRINQHRLEQITKNLAHRGFFAVDLRMLKQQLTNLPWVAAVEVRRVWPSSLMINLREQKPVLIWNNYSVINDMGALFTPLKRSLPTNLPKLDGPTSERNLMIKGYKKMAAMLSAIGLRISLLDLNARQAWRLQLNNGIEVKLGRDNVYTRLRRFIDIYPKVFAHTAKPVKYIDMRYTNGMAVAYDGTDKQ